MKPEKLCIFCEHLNKEEAAFGTTWTGQYGEEGFSCSKGHFSEYDKGKVDTVEEMRILFLTAENCDDYSRDNDTA